MCVDPITMTAMGLSLASSIIGGNQAKQQADMQARALDQEAAAAGQAASFEMERERYKQKLATSAAIAATGAAGVGIAGSPTEAIVANAKQGQLDMEAIGYNTRLRQNTLRTQADISRVQGQQAQTAGYISGISGMFDSLKSVKMGVTASAFARSPRAAMAIVNGGGGLY